MITKEERQGIRCQYDGTLTKIIALKYGKVAKCPLCHAYVSVDPVIGAAIGCTANAELRGNRRTMHVLTDRVIKRKMSADKLTYEEAKGLFYAFITRELNLGFNMNSIAELTKKELIKMEIRTKKI